MLKRLCQSIGLASMILVMNYGDLLGGGAEVRMHAPYALTLICIAQIIDIMLLGLVIFFVLILLQRYQFRRGLLLMGLLVPPLILERTRALIPPGVRHGLVPFSAVIWAGLLLMLYLRFPNRYRQLVRLGDAGGVFLAIFAFSSIAQMIWVMRWTPGPQQHTPAWAQGPQPVREHPLLVWIVFDELSYDKVFEHRMENLKLPHFDALRTQSTVFTNVQPIGYKTARIVPSLLTGHTVDDLRFGFKNDVNVRYTGMHGWHVLDGSHTVFADAQRNKWRTGVVGWYNPYCTLYVGTIDDCYWMNLDKIDGPMAQRATLWANIWSPLAEFVRGIGSPGSAAREDCDYDVRQRYETHVDLDKRVFQMLTTDQDDFVFLHMDVPHSPNIWSRQNDTYAQGCGSSYSDNLVLADRELGRILTLLTASPRWKETTVIVQGDHSWRIDLWKGMPAWTAEDESASSGVFDSRPAVLVHQAGQTQAQTITSRWSLLNVHELLEDVLQGKPMHF